MDGWIDGMIGIASLEHHRFPVPIYLLRSPSIIGLTWAQMLVYPVCGIEKPAMIQRWGGGQDTKVRSASVPPTWTETPHAIVGFSKSLLKRTCLAIVRHVLLHGHLLSPPPIGGCWPSVVQRRPLTTSCDTPGCNP
jgi:hypothetical protein